MARRHTDQEIIAALMEGDFGSLAAGGAQGGPAELPTDPPDSGTQVVDGNRVTTKLRQCQAASCANNAEGRRCTLTAVSINRTGGCDDYEAAADDEDRDDAMDQQTIEGISSMVPTEVDMPTDVSAIVGKYNPDSML